MKNLSKDVQDDSHLRGSFQIPGKMILEISGVISGTLSVCKDAVVNIKGTINGNIFNNGGKIKVLGTVIGTIITNEGTTTIEAGALVCSLEDYMVTW